MQEVAAEVEEAHTEEEEEVGVVEAAEQAKMRGAASGQEAASTGSLTASG